MNTYIPHAPTGSKVEACFSSNGDKDSKPPRPKSINCTLCRNPPNL